MLWLGKPPAGFGGSFKSGLRRVEAYFFQSNRKRCNVKRRWPIIAVADVPRGRLVGREGYGGR